ncbi:hypothetical protein BDZ94DRAFT_1254828 [Collybia nuda]|uniref:DUF6533 domain-containing protein n=1 Tax=Collybia nuda TaxID=64659 RepID=A0A9P5YB88_9AGAR|nr:hypothetical protein BDZ94DRAFT_1254828 [Collybia nuda]
MVSAVFEALMWDQFYYNTALFVSFTVIVFDHILTFSDEINYIWKRKMTPFSVIFLLNRYFVLSMMLRIFSIVVQPTNPTMKFDCTSWYVPCNHQWQGS